MSYSKKIDKINIHFNDSITGKKTIFIFHGWNISKEKLEPLANELIKLNFRVINVDLPGFGQSDGFKKNVGSKEYSEIMHKFILSFKLKTFILFGYSFGGKILINIAPKISKDIPLIFCSSAGIRRSLSNRQNLTLLTLKILKSILGKNYNKLKSKFSLFGAKFAGQYDYANTPNVLKESMGKIVNENFEEELKKIKNKSLLLWGENDMSTPVSDAIKFNEYIKNSVLKIFPDVNHSLPVTKYKEVANQINLYLKNDV